VRRRKRLVHRAPLPLAQQVLVVALVAHLHEGPAPEDLEKGCQMAY
jgi:hypothetical protein